MPGSSLDVRSVLRRRVLVTLRPDQTVRQAAAILSRQEIGACPVLRGDRLMGVLSERDVLQRVVGSGRDPDATLVGTVMTPEPRTIGPHASLVSAFAAMIAGNFRHLPVVDGSGRVIAMLSMRDIPLEHRIMHRQWQEWTGRRSTVAEAEAAPA
jgi:CBS domain-containing protein